MSQADREFWLQDNDYTELARRFEQNIEVVHPTRGDCPVCGKCIWGASSVTYYEYRGESV